MATSNRPRPRAANFYKPGSYHPDESVAFLMRRVLSEMALEVEKQLEPQDLTQAQWVPLYKLYLGHATTAAELAGACQIDAGAMTRTLDRLEAKGLVSRERSAQDRRLVKLALTPLGRVAAEQVPPALCTVLNAHLKGFSTGEWQALKSMLHRMLENALEQKAQRQAPPSPKG